jgi:L-fuculose-phosphate aldolase
MQGVDRGTATEAIIEGGRRLRSGGLIAGAEGNLSVRLDAHRLLVSPTGRRKDELTEADLVEVRLGHDERGARSPSGLAPTSDLAIHLAVYRARPDVDAVVHAHLPASMALTLAGETPDPSALPETALLLPRVPLVAFGDMGSEELAARVAAALAEPPEPLPRAVLLERHGAVAVGPDVGTAVDRLELLEVLCRTWRDHLLLRGARAALG